MRSAIPGLLAHVVRPTLVPLVQDILGTLRLEARVESHPRELQRTVFDDPARLPLLQGVVPMAPSLLVGDLALLQVAPEAVGLQQRHKFSLGDWELDFDGPRVLLDPLDEAVPASSAVRIRR